MDGRTTRTTEGRKPAAAPRAALALTLATLLAVLPFQRASADPLPPYPSAIDHVWTYFDPSPPHHVLSMNFGVKDAVASTTVRVEVFDCFGGVAGVTEMTGSGTFSMWIELYANRKKVGAIIPFRATFMAAGYATDVVEGDVSHMFPEVGEANCAGNPPADSDELAQPDEPGVTVRAWSKKRSAARVGGTARASRTVAPGAQVRYRWIVGGRSVPASGRRLAVTKAMRGKSVVLKIVVSREGFESRTKRLSFGVAR